MKHAHSITDLELLRDQLQEIEKPASQLQWARQNPARAWRVATHTTIERGVVTIDLHDLGRKIAQRVVQICEKNGPSLSTGAVRFVTGRGRHSVTGPVLREVVGDALVACCKRHDWGMHPEGGARFILIIDADKAPSSATGTNNWPYWAAGSGFLALCFFLSPPLGAGLTVVGLLGYLATR